MDSKTRRGMLAKAMLEEIHLRNMLAKFKDINLRTRKVAAIPSVGIFWVDVKTAQVFAEMTSLKDSDDLGEFRIHSGTHYDTWDRMSRRNPAWRGMEYEDIPRGRVVYHKDPHNPVFMVYMSPLLKASKYKNAVAREFNLPTGHVVFDFTDEHYAPVEF